MSLLNEEWTPVTPTTISKLGWRAVIFLVTLLMATLIFLVSGNAIISSVLPCLHAGWKTLRTGLWILRSDPHGYRARVCCAFYVAAACWKAALAALYSVGIFIVIAQWTGSQPSMQEFASTMLVLIIGISLNTLLAVAASAAAVVYKVRVWVHPGLRTDLHGDLRLAAAQSHGIPRFNYAIFVVGTALVFPLVSLGAVLLAVLTVGMSRWDVANSSGAFVGGIAIFALPLAVIPLYAWLSARIIASHPSECWPPHTWPK